MNSAQLAVITMRLDFLSMVLATLASALSQREAAIAVRAIAERIVEQLSRYPTSEGAEEAVAADLAPILAALQQRQGRPMWSEQDEEGLTGKVEHGSGAARLGASRPHAERR